MSKRYIDKDEALKRISWDTEAYTAINMMPTADVVEKERYDRLRDDATILADALSKYQSADMVERKKGKWIIRDNPGTGWYRVTCSECGEDVTSLIPLIGLWDYCPICGADMREGGDAE